MQSSSFRFCPAHLQVTAKHKHKHTPSKQCNLFFLSNFPPEQVAHSLSLPLWGENWTPLCHRLEPVCANPGENAKGLTSPHLRFFPSSCGQQWMKERGHTAVIPRKNRFNLNLLHSFGQRDCNLHFIQTLYFPHCSAFRQSGMRRNALIIPGTGDELGPD